VSAVSRAKAEKTPSAVPQQVAAMALVGVLVFVASLPIVTLVAAGAAGAQLLHEQAELEREPRVRRFVTLLGAALRDPVAVLAVAAVVVVAVLDLLAVLGGVPGARVVGPALAAVGLSAVVCGLRAAACWRLGVRWADAFAEARRSAVADLAGSAMLLGALAVVVLVISQATAFVILAPGMLVLAALAVELRPRAR